MSDNRSLPRHLEVTVRFPVNPEDICSATTLGEEYGGNWKKALEACFDDPAELCANYLDDKDWMRVKVEVLVP